MKRSAFSRVVVIVILGSTLAACGASPHRLPGKLRIEEHALDAAPGLDPLTFDPVGTTQEAVLVRHAGERAIGFPNAAIAVEGQPALSSLGDKGDLVAVLMTSTQNSPRQSVELLRGEKILFTTDAGLPSPVLPLRGLWTYDGHWALEILFADTSAWAGEIFIDGEFVNRIQGYDEAFGFQLLAGNPFFFYQREDHVGFSYDGRETDLDYDQVPHYRCCSESSFNPVPAQNMVAFFAQRGQTWFYVELGDFGA